MKRKWRMEITFSGIVKRVCMLLPFCLFTFLPSSAQSFTERIQQKTNQGEGTVTIHQDQTITDLVNGPAPVAPKQNSIKRTPKPQASRPQATKATTTAVKTDTIVRKQHLDADTLDTTPKQTYKTTGYRVQVFAGGNTRQDRQRAEQAGRALREYFPNEEVYVHFYSPRWICRLGNYRTYEEAHEKMEEVRKMGYDAATIVKGKITLTK